MSNKKQSEQRTINTRSAKSQTPRKEVIVTENNELSLGDKSHVVDSSSNSQEEALKRIETQLEKLELLENLSASVDKVYTLINNMDSKLKEHEERIRTTEESSQQLHLDMTDMKKDLSEKASLERVERLEEKIEDLENRSRRNNIILYNIPKKSEKHPGDCANFVQDFIYNFMEVTKPDGKPIEVERAHRGFEKQNGNPPPIFARILNWKDRQIVLREAPKVLKNKQYNDENKIGITDDVSQKERQKRKALLEQRNKLREEGKYAVIPFRVPAVLIYKDENEHFHTVYPK